MPRPFSLSRVQAPAPAGGGPVPPQAPFGILPFNGHVASSDDAGYIYRDSGPPPPTIGRVGPLLNHPISRNLLIRPIYQIIREDPMYVRGVPVLAVDQTMNFDVNEYGGRRNHFRYGDTTTVNALRLLRYPAMMLMQTVRDFPCLKRDLNYDRPPWLCMIRVPSKDPAMPFINWDAMLFSMIQGALDEVKDGPSTKPAPPPVAVAAGWEYWNAHSIAFSLIGSSNELGYGFGGSADIIVRAVVDWFNDPAQGQTRRDWFDGRAASDPATGPPNLRAQPGWPGVYFLVPHTVAARNLTVTANEHRQRVLAAWITAWDNHIAPYAGPPGSAVAPLPLPAIMMPPVPPPAVAPKMTRSGRRY